ncbi:redoxin domain-containing protein [Halobacillus litoralis]|uniref:TlpA family protein disulfide reductase n=1 Tax=Halobacillus litoralis TaxID=45668 RepID=UPI001CD3469F|nr:TlpA disulfide reductase family protein [Halobacillus litoralis]MCA0969032.1 redoxin domain-containing protein [Halobacillus litoralis]
MWKKVSATVILLFLIGFAVFSFVQDKRAEQADMEKQQLEGPTLVAPAGIKSLQMGDPAPDFELETLDGKTVTLSELKGQKVFLNFWATWCPPCREEMPEMEKFHQEFGDEVKILAINGTGGEQAIGRSEKKKKVSDYVENGNYTFPVLLDMELNVTSEKYQVISIPTTYFIGTDGVIQQPRKNGPMTYEFMVEMKDALK